jgi:hypothetical protein
MRARKSIALSLAACALSACITLPDFESGSIVKGTRVLAVVAEPPEINPGQSLDLSILIAGVEDPSELEVTWRACGSFDGFFGGGGAQYGEGEEDEGCGSGLSFDLGEGLTAQLPGALTSGLFDNLDVIAMTLGTSLPEGIVEEIRSSVGIAFLIEATVRAEGKTIRATKRVLISENETPHQNPPAPRFVFGREQTIVTDAADPLRCVRDDGMPVTAPAGGSVELAPLKGVVAFSDAGVPEVSDAGDLSMPEEEAWLESYNIINSRGELRERKERAFYSWYATAGDLDSGTTKSPLSNNIWRLPGETGEQTLWLIVRDGHGGTSACELTVMVE